MSDSDPFSFTKDKTVIRPSPGRRINLEPVVAEPAVTGPGVAEETVSEPAATGAEVTEETDLGPAVTGAGVTEPAVTEPEIAEPDTGEPEGALRTFAYAGAGAPAQNPEPSAETAGRSEDPAARVESAGTSGVRPDAPRPEVPEATPAAAAAVVPAPPAQLVLPGATARIGEDGRALKVTLARPAGHDGPLRVEWRTLDGTAEDGDDYAGGDWQEMEAPGGATRLVLYVPIVSDARAEAPESFFLEIRRAPGGPAVGEPMRMEVVIDDDD